MVLVLGTFKWMSVGKFFKKCGKTCKGFGKTHLRRCQCK